VEVPGGAEENCVKEQEIQREKASDQKGEKIKEGGETK